MDMNWDGQLRGKTPPNIEGIHKEVLYGIFVYIHKVYDALDWGRALTIIEGYGVVPQVFQLLTQYWYR